MDSVLLTQMLEVILGAVHPPFGSWRWSHGRCHRRMQDIQACQRNNVRRIYNKLYGRFGHALMHAPKSDWVLELKLNETILGHRKSNSRVVAERHTVRGDVTGSLLCSKPSISLPTRSGGQQAMQKEKESRCWKLLLEDAAMFLHDARRIHIVEFWSKQCRDMAWLQLAKGLGLMANNLGPHDEVDPVQSARLHHSKMPVIGWRGIKVTCAHERKNIANDSGNVLSRFSFAKEAPKDWKHGNKCFNMWNST